MLVCFYASDFRRRRHYVFGLSLRPSVRTSKGRHTIFPPVHGSVGPSDQPRPFCGMSVRPSVRSGFRAFAGERVEGVAWIFCMLTYLYHLQNWLNYGYGLLISLLLASPWLSETGQIWGFRRFPGERMEGIASHFVCLCILRTVRTD